MDKFAIYLSDAIVQGADEKPLEIKIDMATDDPDFIAVRIRDTASTKSLAFCASRGLLQRMALAILDQVPVCAGTGTVSVPAVRP